MDKYDLTDDYDFEDDDELTVLIPMEDGSELECDVLLIFEHEDQDYAALYPTSGEPDEIYLFRCFYDGSDSMEIEEIEDDDEFDEVLEVYNAIVEEDEWNELLGYDD